MDHLFLGLPECLDDLGLLEFLEDPEILEHFRRYLADLAPPENQNPECLDFLDFLEDPECLETPNPEDPDFLAIQLALAFLENLELQFLETLETPNPASLVSLATH